MHISGCSQAHSRILETASNECLSSTSDYIHVNDRKLSDWYLHMDTVTLVTRSRMMAAVRGKDTKPELVVRRLIHGLGLRFRLHRRDLPGRPDVVLPRLGLCVFIHGCFWHRHPGCRHATTPSSNVEFWTGKFQRNVDRDSEVQAVLAELGWQVHVIWECETKDAEGLRARLAALLSHATSTAPRMPNRAFKRAPVKRQQGPPRQSGRKGVREHLPAIHRIPIRHRGTMP